MGLLFIIGIVSLAILWISRWYNSPEAKGNRGEQKIASILAGLPEDYKVLNNVVLKTKKGTTQIDHIVVSKYAVFAIETKNYTGDIYGSDNSLNWKQIIVTPVTYMKKWWKTYTYVTKNEFYNPVKQALGHAYAIRDLFPEYTHLPYIPIVVFVGDADLKNVRSTHHVIYMSQLFDVISSYNMQYLSPADVLSVFYKLLQENVGESISKTEHVDNIYKARRDYEEKLSSGICPRCGGSLIKRKGKYGEFFGCSNYPECTYTYNGR